MAAKRFAVFAATVMAAWVAAVSAGISASGPLAVSADLGQAPAAVSFSRTVFPVFEAAQCRGCHNEDGVASATRLHFPEANASPDDIEAFGLTLAVLVDRTDPARSLLINKPTNRERHTGGVRIQPGSFEEQALTDWVRYLTTVSDDAVAAARTRLATASSPSASTQHLRRLTHSQYNNTVRDLLRDYSRPADRFPPEDFINGFKQSAARRRACRLCSSRRTVHRPKSWRSMPSAPATSTASSRASPRRHATPGAAISFSSPSANAHFGVH